jgi:hypothetical protein
VLITLRLFDSGREICRTNQHACVDVVIMAGAADHLPDDTAALKAALIETRAKLAGAQALIEHLQLVIAKMKREMFGPRSERSQRLIDQLELQLEPGSMRSTRRIEHPGLHLGQYRYSSVVAMNALGGEDVRLDQLIERRQRGRASADVIRHGRDGELDALACKLIALTIERLMIGVFADQDHRQQAWPGEAARDRMEGGGRLADLLASPAAELLPHVLGDEPLPQHHIERLGDILADLRELAAAAARARGRRRQSTARCRVLLFTGSSQHSEPPGKRSARS